MANRKYRSGRGGKPYRDTPNEISVGFQGRSKETSKVMKNIVFLQSRLRKPLKIIVFFYFSVSNGIPRDSKASQSQARRDPEHMCSDSELRKYLYTSAAVCKKIMQEQFLNSMRLHKTRQKPWISEHTLHKTLLITYKTHTLRIILQI